MRGIDLELGKLPLCHEGSAPSLSRSVNFFIILPFTFFIWDKSNLGVGPDLTVFALPEEELSRYAGQSLVAGIITLLWGYTKDACNVANDWINSMLPNVPQRLKRERSKEFGELTSKLSTNALTGLARNLNPRENIVIDSATVWKLGSDQKGTNPTGWHYSLS